MDDADCQEEGRSGGRGAFKHLDQHMLSTTGARDSWLLAGASQPAPLGTGGSPSPGILILISGFIYIILPSIGLSLMEGGNPFL